MLFFPGPSKIILKAKEIAIYKNSKTATPIVIDLTNSVRNLEITDKEKLAQEFERVVKENRLGKQSAQLILSEEVLFTKDITSSSPQDRQEQQTTFLSQIPLEPDKIAFLTLSAPEKTTVIATNRHFFESLVEVIKQFGWTVTAVVPITNENPKLANFLTVSSEAHSSERGETPTSRAKKPWLVVLLAIILILILVGGGGSYYFLFIKKASDAPVKKPAAKNAQPVSQTSASESGQTSAPTSEFKKKEDLKILVNNGTGTPGDAGKVKGALLALGYKNVETGNLEVQNASASAVSFNSVVDKSNKDELIAALKKLFASVEEFTATTSAEFDIQINTGQK